MCMCMRVINKMKITNKLAEVKSLLITTSEHNTFLSGTEASEHGVGGRVDRFKVMLTLNIFTFALSI